VDADELRVHVRGRELMHGSESWTERKQRGEHLDHAFVADDSRELAELLLSEFVEKIRVDSLEVLCVRDVDVGQSFGESFFFRLHIVMKDAILREMLGDLGVVGARLLCSSSLRPLTRLNDTKLTFVVHTYSPQSKIPHENADLLDSLHLSFEQHLYLLLLVVRLKLVELGLELIPHAFDCMEAMLTRCRLHEER
jgi:hypothetical protein